MRTISLSFFIAAFLVFAHSDVPATGIQPDSTILIVPEEHGQAQMGVHNTEDIPMLLHVQVIDLPEDAGTSLYATPSVYRVEPRGRQVVRFMLDKPAKPLQVQAMKRVSFEGIPDRASAKGPGTRLRVNVRQTIPVIISPEGLVQDQQPWRFLQARRSGGATLEISNPSAFVVRLQEEVTLVPAAVLSRSLGRSYILPGDRLAIDIGDEPALAQAKALRITPASPWGYMVKPYDIRISP